MEKCFWCGKDAKFYFKWTKRWCCEESYQRCPIAKMINGKSKLGKKASEETKIKMSIKRTGSKRSDKTRSKMRESALIRNQNPEYIQKLRDNHPSRKDPYYWRKHREMHKERMRTCSNPMWNGGTSREPYCYQMNDKEYRRWLMVERDKKSCLNPYCTSGERLSIHHINYIKKDCRPENMITLCNSCNSKANKDREWHQSWYQAIIYRRYISNGK